MTHLPFRLHLLPNRISPAAVAILYAVVAGLWIVASDILLTLAVTDPVLKGYLELIKGLLFVAVTSGLLFCVATLRDISARKESAATIQRLTQLYSALSQCNQSIVRCTGEDELFHRICHDVVQFGGMKMAWIGLLDEASGQVRPGAAYGEGIDYLADIQISAAADSPLGRGPTGTAIRERQPVWCDDFQNDPASAPWQERSARFGWGASAALPLYRNGVVVGSFTLYAGQAHAFDDAAQELLTEMATDISFALDNYARESARQQAVLALQDSEAFNISVLDSLAEHIAVLDAQGAIIAVNRAWRCFAKMNDAPELIDKSVGLNYLDVCDAAPGHAFGQAGAAIEAETGIRAVLAGTQPEFHLEYPCHSPDGQRWFQMHVTPLQGSRPGAVIAHENISERKQHEAQLHLAAKVFEQSGEGITITDAQRNIVMVNQAFTRITGYSEADALGKNPRMLSSGRQDQEFYRAMWKTVNAQGYWQGEVWNRRKDSSVYPESLSISQVRDASGTPTHYIGIFSDISQHKAAQEHIQRLAHFDSLTGLPNRSLLKDRINQALSSAQRNQTPLALMFLDLDHFKNINDSLGHRIGDELLIALARRLTVVVREQDTVSRLGGDEFILVLPDTDADGAAHVAEKLLESALQPYQIEQHELTITPSIGIAMYPSDGEDFDTLSKRADAAMYRAKQAVATTTAFLPRKCRPAPRTRCNSKTRCGVRWNATSCCCTISPRFALKMAASSAPKRCCAGSTPSWAWCRRPSSFRLPKTAARSCRSANGCCARPHASASTGSPAAWRR